MKSHVISSAFLGLLIALTSCSSVVSTEDSGTSLDGVTDGLDGDTDAGGDDGGDSGGDEFADPDACMEGRPDCCGNGVCEEGEEDCACNQDCGDCYQVLWGLELESISLHTAYTLSLTSNGDIIAKAGSVLYSIAREGDINWRVDLPFNSSWSHPVLSPEGDIILINGSDDILYWHDLDGTILAQDQFIENPGYPHNGGMQIACNDQIVCLNPRGVDGKDYHIVTYLLGESSQVWSRGTLHGVEHYLHPTIASDGSLFLSGQNDLGDGRYFYLLHFSQDGELLWRDSDFSDYRIVDWDSVVSAPVLGPEDQVYFLSGEKILRSYSRDGEFLWYVLLEACTRVEPLVGPDGTVYVTDREGFAYAVSPDGDEIWKTRVGWLYEPAGVWQSASTTPLLTSDGFLIIPLWGGIIRVVRAANGAIEYDIVHPAFPSPLFQAPLMDDNGVLYVTQSDWVIAVQTRHAGLADGYWVRGFGNARSNSSVTIPASP